jgi:hypothetical protein
MSLWPTVRRNAISEIRQIGVIKLWSGNPAQADSGIHYHPASELLAHYSDIVPALRFLGLSSTCPFHYWQQSSLMYWRRLMSYSYPVNWALEFEKTLWLIHKKVPQLVVLWVYDWRSDQCNFRNQTDRSERTLKRQSSTGWFWDPLQSDVQVTWALLRHSYRITLPRTFVNLPFPLLTETMRVKGPTNLLWCTPW